MTRPCPLLDELWRRSAGLPPAPPDPMMPPLEELRVTEWSLRFERLQRNRLVLGAFRYGRLHQPSKAAYARVDCCIRRLCRYAKTGAMELLVDVANMCMLEFEEGRHPLRHWAPADDGPHTQRIAP